MIGKKAKAAFITVLTQLPLYTEAIIVEKPPKNPFAIPLEERIDLEPQEDELLAVERLIRFAEQQLKDKKQLKILITEMRQNKELFIKGDGSKLHATYMIQAAKKSLRIIRKYHLEQLFAPEFIEELSVFSKVGSAKISPSLY